MWVSGAADKAKLEQVPFLGLCVFVLPWLYSAWWSQEETLFFPFITTVFINNMCVCAVAF